MVTLFYAFCGVLLVCIGLAGTILQKPYLKKILALNLFTSGIFLILIGSSGGGEDPIASAMVLTGIVVALAATAVGLALIRALHVREGE